MPGPTLGRHPWSMPTNDVLTMPTQNAWNNPGTSDAVTRGKQRTDRLPCLEQEVDLWFSDKPAEIEAAKRLCAECPIQELCLSGAVERAETAGVWGGQLFVNGRIVAFKRPRGRPRKHVA